MIDRRLIQKLLLCLLLLQMPVFADNFVLITQPKTGTGLVKAILTELTGQKGYWPKQELGYSYISEDDYRQLSLNDSYIFFAVGSRPCESHVMDTLLKKCEEENS